MLSVFLIPIPTDHWPFIHFRLKYMPSTIAITTSPCHLMPPALWFIPRLASSFSCMVIFSQPRLVVILVFYSAAFISFEYILFILTLIKFLDALRSGWGCTPVVFLHVRDGTWAFILIFGSSPFSFSTILAHLPCLHPVTLCVNAGTAGFYVGEGNVAIAAIGFPWLLSIKSFVGARIVLNLHAISSNLSTDTLNTTVDGTLSSHIVFTTHSMEDGNCPRNPSMRWDWGGIQTYSHGQHSKHAASSRGDTGTTSESYELTSTGGSSTLGIRKHSVKAEYFSHPTHQSEHGCTCSGTCVEAGMILEEGG
jgi:hypothetical protein